MLENNKKNKNPQDLINNLKSKNTNLIIISIVITALVVGSFVYAVQRQSFNRQRQELEQRIERLESQVSGLPETKEEAVGEEAPQKETTQKETPPADLYAGWKTYSDNNFHFTLKYPSTLKVSCPTSPSCFLGSLQLSNQHYSTNNIPANAVVINLGSFGVESDTTVTDPYQWRKNWANGLNTSATYKRLTVNGQKALEERTLESVTVYISTGTGRVLAFTLLPLNPSNEKLFNSILETVTIAK